jgi:hypothetical protein
MRCIKLRNEQELLPISMPGMTRRIMIAQTILQGMALPYPLSSLHLLLHLHLSSLCLRYRSLLPMFLQFRYRFLPMFLQFR